MFSRNYDFLSSYNELLAIWTSVSDSWDPSTEQSFIMIKVSQDICYNT